MSLLLEALKKAEKAKEEAQRGAKESSAPDAQRAPEPPAGEGGKRVVTRDELPDISAPLEIYSEDLTSGAPPTASAPTMPQFSDPPAAAAPVEQPRAAVQRDPMRTATAVDQPPSERAMARNSPETKFREPNPRLPFYITVGVLTLAAVAVAVYFWMQLRPPAPLVNPNPPRTATEKPVATAVAPAGGQTVQGPVQAQIPGLPTAPAETAPAPAPSAAAPPAVAPVTPPPSAASVPAAAAKPAAPGEAKPAAPPARVPAGAAPARTAPRPAAPAAAPSDEATTTGPAQAPLTFSRSAPQINPRVATGYNAYQAGDLASARNEYQQALASEPTNRDALLGLAAVEMRAQRYDVAESLYQRLLRADPRDPHANAGLLALRARQLDPVTSESRVKTLLAQNPDSGVLQFTLGNQLAQQGRWAEAQQAYFKAHTSDPENPDFAFNLAVSLDQLRQPGLALEHYRRAIALADKRVANFSLEAARARVQQLAR